jgi:hypothetical protein
MTGKRVEQDAREGPLKSRMEKNKAEYEEVSIVMDKLIDWSISSYDG